jgi:hypothetical protein
MENTAPLWLFAGATLFWGVAALVGASDGGESMYDTLLYFYGGLFFGGATLAVALLFAIRGIGRRIVWWRLLPLPVALQLGFLVLVFFGVSFDQAFQARFAISRGALHAAVDAIQSGRRPAEPGWSACFGFGVGEDIYVHLDGPWWRWHRSW